MRVLCVCVRWVSMGPLDHMRYLSCLLPVTNPISHGVSLAAEGLCVRSNINVDYCVLIRIESELQWL